jgi:hypothetical protein
MLSHLFAALSVVGAQNIELRPHAKETAMYDREGQVTYDRAVMRAKSCMIMRAKYCMIGRAKIGTKRWLVVP